MSNQGYWIYGVHRLNRILMLLIPNDFAITKLEEYFLKMSKEYFSKAYIWNKEWNDIEITF